MSLGCRVLLAAGGLPISPDGVPVPGEPSLQQLQPAGELRDAPAGYAAPFPSLHVPGSGHAKRGARLVWLWKCPSFVSLPTVGMVKNG